MRPCSCVYRNVARPRAYALSVAISSQELQRASWKIVSVITRSNRRYVQKDIYVRPVEQNGVRLYKFFRQAGPRKYELIEELAGYGFVSKARAEKKARELERRA